MDAQRVGNSERSRWRVRGAWFGALVLGAVLLIAAWGKALDPVAFAEQINYEGLDFLVPAQWLAWLVIVAEVVLGVALILGLRSRGVLAATGVLIVVFVFLTTRAFVRWRLGIELEAPDCGCFGNLVSRSPGEAFWQDLTLLVPPYLLCWLQATSGGIARSLKRWALVATCGVIAFVFALLSPGLPLDNLATRLSPGVRVDELCAGSKRDAGGRVCLDLLLPELATGRHVVVLDTLESPTLLRSLDGLNELVGVEGQRVWLLNDAGAEEQQLFFWKWGPLFDVREVPRSLLRPLYRTLPRSCLVRDGVVVKTWPDLPDFGAVSEAL